MVVIFIKSLKVIFITLPFAVSIISTNNWPSSEYYLCLYTVIL